MTSRERWLLVVAIGMLGCLGVYMAVRRGGAHEETASAPVIGDGNPYSPEETQAFFTAAQKAEAIADPLQRCLDYPDPPGSHWTRIAVVAYCHNQLSTGLTFGEIKTQVEAGHAQAVDRRLEELLQAQFSGKSAWGALDTTYETDFDGISTDVRSILDAWKRQSPQSAFAYAASGTAYVRAAWDARGTAWAADTTQSNFDSMQRLSVEAAADLDRAVALDQRVMPAYAAMIRLGGLNGEAGYAFAAAKRGLRVDPSNYLIYSRLTWLAQPKWGGSIEEMRKVIAASQRHVAQNPLLTVIQHQSDAIAAGLDDCGCSDSFNPEVIRTVFDQVIAKSWLGGAGLSAHKANQDTLAVIFLSEAL